MKNVKKDQPEASEGRVTGKLRSGRKPDVLREQAERRLSERSTPTRLQDARKVLHELEVHQIELEMQNEALRQAHVTLIASEEKYSDLYDFAPIGYFTFDRTGLISEVNLTGASLLGVERGQLKSKPFSLFVATPSRDAFHRHYRGILKTGAADSCELQVIRKDGTSFYALMQSVPVRDGEGNPIGVRSAIGDITERRQAEALRRARDELELRVQERTAQLQITNDGLKAEVTQRARAEAQLRESKDRLSNILESITDAFFTLDRDWRFTYVNGRGEWLWKKSRDELIGKHLWNDIAPKTVGTIIYEQYQKAMQEQVPVTFEAFSPTVGIWFEAHLYPSRDGLSVYARNITERRTAEEQLLRLAVAVESVAEGINVASPDGTIQYANPAFCHITGYTQEELIGRNARMFRSGRHDEAFYQAIWDTVESGRTWSGRLTGKKKDGTVADFDLSASPITNRSGTIINYATITRDVTDELRQESQLRQAQKMQAIGTLAGGITHDFNNILAAIIGFTEMVFDESSPGSPGQRRLGLALRAARRGRELVRQILAFSRQGEKEYKPVKVSSILQEALKLLRPSLPSTIEIRQNISSADNLILADEVQIHQVLMNLCTNAAHAMRERGGVLEIALAAISREEEPLPAGMKPGPHVRLSVRDTGCGMTPETMERMFEPFFTTKQPGEGTGLGLSVVHGIVENHGGCIAVKSEPGKGTTFNLYFPEVEPGDHDASAVLSAVPKGCECLLFVDDEEMLVELNRERLQSLGYNVVTTTSSVQALEIFKEEPDRFDLVITDLTMPHLTGIDLARELLTVRPATKIILCSGLSETVPPETIKEVGIRMSVPKTMDRRELAELVRRVLDHGTNEL